MQGKEELDALARLAPSVKQTEAEAVEKFRKEIDSGRAELRARVAAIKRGQEEEKRAWLWEELRRVMPDWAFRQVLQKGRGWVCRLFGVRVNYFFFDKDYAEQIMVMKRGNPVALKLFKWDDGKHLEGRLK